MTERLPNSLPEITPRQREVARLVAEGLTNEEIAARLDLSLAGAKYHVSELLGRLGVERREEIVAWYRRGGVQPRPWLRWQRALIALAAGLVGAVAIAAMAVGVPAGASTAPPAAGTEDDEAVSRARIEALLTGLLDGGVLYVQTEHYHRDGHAWRLPPASANDDVHSITLPERYVHHLWQIYDGNGTLQHTIGAVVGEDGVTYERLFRSEAERFETREVQLVDYLATSRFPGKVITPLDLLRALDEDSGGLRDAVATGEAEAEPDNGRVTVVLRNRPYPCARVRFPDDLFALRVAVREEWGAEESTYLSDSNACWVELRDGAEVLLDSTSTTYEVLDSSEWDTIMQQVWPDGVPTPVRP